MGEGLVHRVFPQQVLEGRLVGKVLHRLGRIVWFVAGGGFWRWRRRVGRYSRGITPSSSPSYGVPRTAAAQRPVQREERDGARELDAGEGAAAPFECGLQASDAGG